MSESLVKNQHVLTKVYFPRVLVPIAAMTVGLVDYLVALLPAALLVLALGIRPGWAILWFPVWLFGTLLWTLACGLIFASLNARYRDVGHVIPFLLQIGLFISPVVYESAAVIPDKYLTLYRLNPLAVLLDGLRWSLVGAERPEPISMCICAAIVVSVLFAAWRLFHQLDRTLVDRI